MKVDFGKDCIGCGLCVGECPEVFEFDSDLYQAKLNPIAEFDRYVNQIRKAALACPVDNIKLRD